MMDRWSELKIETKFSFLALFLSIIVFSINEARYYNKEKEAEERATIKLNIIDLMSVSRNLDRSTITLKYITEHDDVSKQRLSQALYELMNDGIVVYTKSTNTYELVSFSSIYENKGHTLDIVKHNIATLLRKHGSLDKDQILESYIERFGIELSQKQLNDGLYEVLNDGVVVFSLQSKIYQMRSFNLIE